LPSCWPDLILAPGFKEKPGASFYEPIWVGHFVKSWWSVSAIGLLNFFS
jgi:hypothetical protein